MPPLLRRRALVSTDEYITILSCLGDIQAAIDATALDVERLLDASGVSCSSANEQVDDLDLPDWVNGD